MVAGVLVDAAMDRVVRSRPAAQHLLHERTHPTEATLRLALDRGCEFLRRTQRSDGAFVDFLLEPGASDTWISAHVLFILERVQGLSRAFVRAVDYLETVGQRDGAWGYNQRVAPDLDSTAQALMALQRHGRAIDRNWIDFVLAQQAPSGGFPTYPPTGPSGQPAHGWQAVHPDVTLIVMELLRRLGREAERERALLYLRTLGDDVVAPYWWNTRAYAAWASVRAGFETATTSAVARELLAHGASSMPTLAMLLSAAGDTLTQAERTTTLARLLGQQLADGSWPCDPCLRVTNPASAAASEAAPGRQFAGNRRVLSTTHAVAAIVGAGTPIGVRLPTVGD